MYTVHVFLKLLTPCFVKILSLIVISFLKLLPYQGYSMRLIWSQNNSSQFMFMLYCSRVICVHDGACILMNIFLSNTTSDIMIFSNSQKLCSYHMDKNNDKEQIKSS